MEPFETGCDVSRRRAIDFSRNGTAGFTLIELMLVVAIIGLLAAIALPKFGEVLRKAKEASVRGKLGSLRSAMELYYVDNEGALYPRWTTNQGVPLLVPKYIDAIPPIGVPHWDDSPETNQLVSNIAPNCDLAHAFDDRYVYQDFISPPRYVLYVACIHTDARRGTWSQY